MGGSPSGEAAQWALRFISGKYQGGEFPLRPHREIVIGRSSDLDMCWWKTWFRAGTQRSSPTTRP